MTAARLPLLGLTEVGEALGVSRQRAHAVAAEPGFPAPWITLKQGRIWRTGDVVAWALADPRYTETATRWQTTHPTPDPDDDTRPDEPGATAQWCVRLADDPFTEAIGNTWYGARGERIARWWQEKAKPGATVYRRRIGPWEAAPARQPDTRPEEGTPS